MQFVGRILQFCSSSKIFQYLLILSKIFQFQHNSLKIIKSTSLSNHPQLCKKMISTYEILKSFRSLMMTLMLLSHAKKKHINYFLTFCLCVYVLIGWWNEWLYSHLWDVIKRQPTCNHKFSFFFVDGGIGIWPEKYMESEQSRLLLHDYFETRVFNRDAGKSFRQRMVFVWNLLIKGLFRNSCTTVFERTMLIIPKKSFQILYYYSVDQVSFTWKLRDKNFSAEKDCLV